MSIPVSLRILRNEFEEMPNIPKQLMLRLANFICHILWQDQPEGVDSWDPYNQLYNLICFKANKWFYDINDIIGCRMRISGWRLSSAIIQGEREPERSTKFMDCKLVW